MKTHFLLRLTTTASVIALFSFHLLAGTSGASQFGQLLPTAKQEAFEPEKPRKAKKCKGRRCAWSRPQRVFGKGQLDASGGIGLLPTFLMDGARADMPPLMLGVEYRFSEHFSTGLTLGGAISSSQPKIFNDGLQATWTNHLLYAALRPAVHITRVEDWDFYGGFSIGLHRSYVHGKSNGNEEALRDFEAHLGIQPRRTTLAYSGFAGFRRSVSNKITLGGELGFGVSLLTVGLTYRLH